MDKEMSWDDFFYCKEYLESPMSLEEWQDFWSKRNDLPLPDRSKHKVRPDVSKTCVSGVQTMAELPPTDRGPDGDELSVQRRKAREELEGIGSLASSDPVQWRIYAVRDGVMSESPSIQLSGHGGDSSVPGEAGEGNLRPVRQRHREAICGVP